MKKNRAIIILLSCLALAFGVFFGVKQDSTEVNAGSAVVVRVPFDGSLSHKGVLCQANQICNYGVIDSRIHQFAAGNTGIAHSYKEYVVMDFDAFEDLVATDGFGNILPITNVKMGYVDYMGADPTFVAAVEPVVMAAMNAYHERLNGRGSDATLANYFLTGTPAYSNALAINNCRKWGAFYTPNTIKVATVSEVFQYGPNDFTAKCTVSCGTYFADNYTLAMVFHRVGNSYKVTNFTYMP